MSTWNSAPSYDPFSLNCLESRDLPSAMSDELRGQTLYKESTSMIRLNPSGRQLPVEKGVNDWLGSKSEQWRDI
jgi:hypothetical protein